jgi:hypothetical protein
LGFIEYLLPLIHLGKTYGELGEKRNSLCVRRPQRDFLKG